MRAWRGYLAPGDGFGDTHIAMRAWNTASPWVLVTSTRTGSA